MIQSGELKRNNLVKDDSGKIITVESVGEFGINLTTCETDLSWEYDLEKIFGIELTPEILEKCGFENIGSDDLGGWFTYRNKGVDLSVGVGGFHFNHGRAITFLFYIHQLQNLYFSLTGEELKIIL